MRPRLIALFAVVAAAGTTPSTWAEARPRIEVVPFVSTGAQGELSYFAPEVTRAVIAALQRLGIDVGPDGEWPITGKLEPLAADRVRLVGQLHARTAVVEGTVDDIDVLVDQLSAKLVGLLLDIERPRAGEVRPRPSPHGRAAGLPHKLSVPAVLVAETPRSAAVPVEPPHTDPPEKAAEPSHESGSPVVPSPAPPQPEKAVVVSYPAFVPSFVRGRVVAHSVADAPGSYIGTGQAASQALYLFLNRRLRLSIVPTGTGLSSLQTATAEGERAGARFVVMMRLKEVVYGSAGVHCRLEVVVVRQGELVYRRLVDSPSQSPNMRGREDPVFAAVMLGLDALYPELLPLLAAP